MQRSRTGVPRVQLLLAALSVQLLFVACATPYQPRGFTGGYTDAEVQPGVHFVEYAGNGYTSEAQVVQHWHRRAAEICGGADRYEVLSGSSGKTTHAYGGGQYVETQTRVGNSTIKSGYVTVPIQIDKASARGYVRCLEPPKPQVAERKEPPEKPRRIPTKRAEDFDLPTLVERVRESVVTIFSAEADPNSAAQGTGFYFAPGLVATNLHVVANAKQIVVRLATGELVGARIDRTDEAADLAVLATIHTGTPLPLARGTPREGERVAVIGSPRGLEASVSDGIVSALRPITDDLLGVQITAPISPGSSGSPVLNLRGEVIGIATFQVLDGQSLNFAMPASRLQSLAAELPDHRPAWQQTPPKEVTVENAEAPALERELASTVALPPYVESKIAGLDLASMSLDAIASFEAAIAADADKEVSVEEKIRLWELVATKIPPAAELAGRRQQAWVAYRERREKRKAEILAREEQWAKVDRLLQLSAIADEEKERLATQFVATFGETIEHNPHISDLRLLEWLRAAEWRSLAATLETEAEQGKRRDLLKAFLRKHPQSQPARQRLEVEQRKPINAPSAKAQLVLTKPPVAIEHSSGSATRRWLSLASILAAVGATVAMQQLAVAAEDRREAALADVFASNESGSFDESQDRVFEAESSRTLFQTAAFVGIGTTGVLTGWAALEWFWFADDSTAVPELPQNE